MLISWPLQGPSREPGADAVGLAVVVLVPPVCVLEVEVPVAITVENSKLIVDEEPCE